MKKHTSKANGFTLISVMIISVILLIVIKFVFAQELPGWEGEMWHSIGMSAEKGRLTASIYLLVFFTWKVILGRKVRKHKKLRLPR